MEHIRTPNFDMEGLRTFFMVVKCKSFSEAAEQLHKTPATISYRIRALEDQIGMPLFKRSTRTVELLPAGEHLMELTNQIYGLLQQIPKELEQVSLGIEPEFVITVNNLLSNTEATATLLQLLHERFPYTRFIINRAVYMGVWDALIHNRADFAIGVPSWHSIDHQYETLPIGEIRWKFICAPNHPILQFSDTPLSDDILSQWVAINVEDTSTTMTKRKGWLLRGQHEIIVPNMSSKLQCHLKGIGVGFMPEALVSGHLARGELVTLEVSNPRTPSPMGVAWKRDARGHILDFIKKLFQDRSPVIHPFMKSVSGY